MCMYLCQLCFCSIGDSDDPKIRMVEAVRYYLSAFHTARRVSTIIVASDWQHHHMLSCRYLHLAASPHVTM